jgi:hypothetical protein
MTEYNYRFSIIPPGAITDARVTPRALQVLCLLGRHIDNGGWCTRSQVKMARELGCSRSAVQDACNLLIETGWAETRRNGRGGTAPDSSEQPFAAFSYRVRMDRDDLPVKSSAPTEQTALEAEGGATIAAGGAAQAAGGATMAAPLEGIPSEGISSEPERETRARDHEEFARWLSAFLLRWPTAAADDQSRIANAARALEKPARKLALEKVPSFLDYLKKIGRKHPPAGWKYLEERRWEQLPDTAKPPDAAVAAGIDEGSPQWLAWEAVFRIARPRAGIPSFRMAGVPGSRKLHVPKSIPDGIAALASADIEWVDYVEGSNGYAAWRRWLCELIPPNLIELYEVGGRRALRAPATWPPRKDGTLSDTGPPAAA